MKMLQIGFGIVLIATVADRSAMAAGRSCETLASMVLPHTSITLAQPVAAGSFVTEETAARGTAQNDAVTNLPAFCRVAAALRPTSDSDIKIEVWMPASGWNQKFLAVGNGGWSGSIAYPAMMEALRRGYATSSTDTGHQGATASFALGHPEKLIDFGYRAVHEMTVTAKQLVEAHYGDTPKFSYWSGCSAGGRQGLKEAQRFPADYDGIIAGAPGADWTGRAAASIRVAQAMHVDDASYIPPAKYSLIHNAVLEACDALDGVKDGVIENPKRCKFDPKTLECNGADKPTCLTTPQVTAARKVYAPAMNPKTKREIASLEPGSELGWATWGGPQPLRISFDHFKYVVFKDPDWDYAKFNFENDIVLAERIDDNTINALEPNLKPFFDRGGKLLQYHGWNDPQISPGNSLQYYDRVSQTIGGARRLEESYRLFMVPGMAHCGGGEGPNTFDTVGALERWVEKHQAPDQLVASLTRDGRIVRTRPLCPHPQVATYNKTGSTDDAVSFACTAP